MATREIVKGHCGDSKCTYDVYTKEKIDEILIEKENAIKTLNEEITTLKAKTIVKEEVVNVPFIFRTQVQNSEGVYKDEKIYDEQLNIPVSFVKQGNNILAHIRIIISIGTETEFGYRYSEDSKDIHVTIPESDISGKTWRVFLTTSSVPDKYAVYGTEAFYEVTDDNIEKTGYSLYSVCEKDIWLYLRGEAGTYSVTYNYFGANTD